MIGDVICMIGDIKIVFMGTPEFSAIVLEKMIESVYTPMAVVTAPDKPVGRKQILTASPVKVLAEKNKIPVLQPVEIGNCKLKIENLQPDLIILAAFGQIIPKEILETPKYGCLNIHPSLLPKYRGASPIQTAILNNDTETGVTIMLMDELMDHGQIITNDKLLITNNETTEELTKKLAKLGGKLLIETIPKWVKGEIKAQPQDHDKATFTKIIKKENGKIDWQKSAEEIERMIRAYNPWPSAYTQLTTNNKQQTTKILPPEADQPPAGKILKILKAEVLKTEEKKEPGTVFLTIIKELAVACGKNALILEEVQLEGKNITTAKNFLNGYSEIIGEKLK